MIGNKNGRFSSSTFKDYSSKKIKNNVNISDEVNSVESSVIMNDNKNDSKNKRNSIVVLVDNI